MLVDVGGGVGSRGGGVPVEVPVAFLAREVEKLVEMDLVFQGSETVLLCVLEGVYRAGYAEGLAVGAGEVQVRG